MHVKKDVIIIGAGASGLFCAIESGKRARSVLIIDHTGRTGNKIRVSGGGRCNFSNLSMSAVHYVSQNPHFCKSALARFRPADFTSLLDRHGVGYHEEHNGQLFCDKGAADIMKMLKRECGRANVDVRLNCSVSGIRKDRVFTVTTDQETFQSTSLVIASGGLSYPGLGASDMGHRIARQFGIRTTRLRPGLVPLTFRAEDAARFRGLRGVSLCVKVRCKGKEFLGNILFTDRGLSGPAILQTSLYWEKGDILSINLFPETDVSELFLGKQKSRMEMKNLLSAYHPQRFTQKWCDAYIQSKPLCQYTLKELQDITSRLHNWEIRPAGTEGFGKAEVTIGGIDTDELSSKTMESKKIPGLFFTGEVIDVTGQLGGYNLHWAWASGYAAGQYA